tara:strand:- start:1013 stop:1207 length:195 start_codon:yes stop_codon:yes gene_type:complete
VADKNIIHSKDCKIAIKKAKELLGTEGRLLVRKSGTESKVRIMGECHNRKLLAKAIQVVSRSIK